MAGLECKTTTSVLVVLHMFKEYSDWLSYGYSKVGGFSLT